MNKVFLGWVRVVAAGLMLGLPVVPALAQSVGASIGASGSPPNANAMLDVESPATGSGKGMLVPRMTVAQRTSASAALEGGLLDDAGDLRGGAAQGLLVYQTDGAQGFYYNTSATATPAWAYVGSGDFMADGSVAMAGSLNMGGNSVTNGAFVGDGSGLTGIPASAVTEADPVWTAASNAVATAIGERLASNVWAVADSTTNYASRVDWTATNAALLAQIGGAGDFMADGTVAMTGNLDMGGQAITNISGSLEFASGDTAVGRSANGIGGTAVGSSANGANSGVALGASANGNNQAISIGAWSEGYDRGVALGYSSHGYNDGVAIGSQVWAINGGTAIGSYSGGNMTGTAVGVESQGSAFGVAVGAKANGAYTNIAIGYRANARGTAGMNRIAIGQDVTNAVDDSAAMRGTLYLDGGTNVMVRSTFGSGAWTPLVGVAGDFKSDGTVAMTGPINMNNRAVTNVFRIYMMSDSTAVGRSAVASSESVAIGYLANGYSYGYAMGSTATAMTESVSIGRKALADNNSVTIGNEANAYYESVALGYQANAGGGNCVAIGVGAKAEMAEGTAIGYYANAGQDGAAVGYYANGNRGAALGAYANGYYYGNAIGQNANGYWFGAALGYGAFATNHAIAVGRYATGTTYSIAMGYKSSAHGTNIAIGHQATSLGINSIAIGQNVTNVFTNAVMIRGNLYMDGGAGAAIYYRNTFGSGAWSAKAFTIDHPLDPENKVLRHFCMEGPEVWNVYAGNAQLVNGKAVVDLPDYYSALNKVGSEVYSLTVVDGSINQFPQVKIAQKVTDNEFTIRGTHDVEVSWSIKVLRNDPGCLEDLQRRPVEQLKSELTPEQTYFENQSVNTFNASR